MPYSLPLFGDSNGNNYLPTIHVFDMATIVRYVVIVVIIIIL
jgi:hypothetical protein